MYAAQKPYIINDECIYLCLLMMGTNPETELCMDATQMPKAWLIPFTIGLSLQSRFDLCL